MKKPLALSLQIIFVLIGLAVLAFMIREPLFEGRNANATLFQVYFNDPFLAYAYASSIAFFLGLYQAIKLAGYAGQGKAVSADGSRAARAIKLCACALIVLIAGPLAYLFVVRPGDDIAGGVAAGLFLIIVSSVIAFASAKLERRLSRSS